MSFSAFSLKKRTSDLGSSTIGSIFLPRTPPLALISSIASNSALCNDRSMIAIVPLRECRMPTLIVLSCALAWVKRRTKMDGARNVAAPAVAAAAPFSRSRLVSSIAPPLRPMVGQLM